jgi:hypothetical protein
MGPMPRVPEAARPLAELLDRLTASAAPQLVRVEGDGRLRCVACGHRCRLMPGLRGVCQVRRNEGGERRVPVGYVGALQSDPVEKRPFFHVLPGALTFGMLGCDTCASTVVRRHGYLVLEDRLTQTRGHCPNCGTAIPGIWSS